MPRKILLILLLSFLFQQIHAQTSFEYPSKLKTDTLYVPLFDYYPVTKKMPVSLQEKKEYDRVVRRNKKIEKANEMVKKIMQTNYPFAYKTIRLGELDQLGNKAFVLESFSQLNRKMAYYYRENPELLEALLDEGETTLPQFKDVYIYYYITVLGSDKEYIMVDFGRKNINQALRYFCQSISAYFNEL